jgi:hypothetical protein
VLVPVVLFAGTTVLAQQVSPAKGQSLLPTLPDIIEVPLASGGQAEVYLSPGSPGPNEFHLFLPSPPSVAPVVTASRDGGAPRRLGQFLSSPAHYIAVVVLTPGAWRFSVRTTIDHRSDTFSVERTLSP